MEGRLHVSARRWLAVALGVIGVGSFAIAGAAAASALGTDWRDKVDAQVLDAAAAGSTSFFVDMDEKADLSGAEGLATKAAKGRYVYDRLTAVARESQSPVKAALDARGTTYRSFWISNALVVTGDLGDVEALARRGDVAHVYGIGSGQLDLPADVPGGTTNHAPPGDPTVFHSISLVNADDVWALGYRGQGAVVAGADTGIRWTHEAIKAKYRGWDGTAATHDYNWHDAIPVSSPTSSCPASSPTPCDDNSHGTHTVGTILGTSAPRSANGNVAHIGMAPDAEWIGCRNMVGGYGVVPTYLECMEWILAPTRTDGTGADPAKAPDVVNNSWGCVEGCPPPALQDTLQASRAAGIFYSVSAGNDGGEGPAFVCSSIFAPLSRYPEAFTVGSTTWNTDTIAPYSSRGPVLLGDVNQPLLLKPNISAPGSSVMSATNASDTSYGTKSGTSMASPHVAGLVALIISAKPSLAGNVDRIEDIIEQSAIPKTTSEPCGGPGAGMQVPNNTYGWGRIDALRAIALATANNPPNAVDDEAATLVEEPVSVAVLANDSDPDNDALAVTGLTQPANGSAQITGGTVTYTPNDDFAGTDTFTYTISDPRGATDTATVTVTVRTPNEVKGGGWLATGSGAKINFGLEAEETPAGAEGSIELNDKATGAKIKVKDILYLGPVTGACGTVEDASNALELRGSGTYGKAAASFRACVADNGKGKEASGPDLLYLECTGGCSYRTSDSASDDALDGGNIDVARSSGTTPAGQSAPAGEPEPSTMILGPVLIDSGVIGQLQTLTVRVYDQYQEPLANAAVALTQTTATGSRTLTALTGATGVATLVTANAAEAAEYRATAGAAESNTVAIQPLTR